MGLARDIIDAVRSLALLGDKIDRSSEALKSHQAKIEELTGRVIRLETALEIALRGRGEPMPTLPSRPNGPPGLDHTPPQNL